MKHLDNDMQLPSPGSTCLNRTVLEIQESGYSLLVTFASLFDVVGVYQAMLTKGGECLVNTCGESHLDVMSEAMAKIKDVVPEQETASLLSDAIYNAMLEMDGDELHTGQPYAGGKDGRG